MRVVGKSVMISADVDLAPGERFRVARRFGKDPARDVLIDHVRSGYTDSSYWGSGRWTNLDGTVGERAAERVRLSEQDVPVAVRGALAVARFAAVQELMPGLRAAAEQYRSAG